MSQKGFAAPVLLFIVLLAVAGVAIYSFQSQKPLSGSSPETAANQPEFKNYVDAGQGFEFKYSSSFSVLEDSQETYNKRNGGYDYAKNFTGTYGYPPPTLIKGVILKSNSSADLSSSPFTLWIFDNPNNFSPERWYENYWYYPFVWGEYEPKKSLEGPDREASLSGQITHSRILNYVPGKPKFIYLPYKGKMYLFRIIGKEDILNSFEFLN